MQSHDDVVNKTKNFGSKQENNNQDKIGQTKDNNEKGGNQNENIKDIKESAKNLYNETKNNFNEAKEDVKESAKHAAKDLADPLTQYVQKDPLKALGFAALAGVFLTLFLKK